MARNFDATDDTIRTHFPAPGAITTYSIWVRRTATSGTRAIFNDGLAVSLYDNAAQYVFERVWSTQTGVWTVTRPAVDVWTHVVIRYNGSATTNDPTIYFNGVSQTVSEFQPPTGTLTTSPGDFWLGSFGGSSGFWAGDLAEFAIWNIILATADVTALAAGDWPLTIEPDSLLSYVPILGSASPEPDWGEESTADATVTGTTTATHPATVSPTVWSPPSGAASPTLAIEIAPDDGVWVVSPTWVDITEDVMGFNVTLSGRQRETEQVQAASGNMQLRNHERAYDPTHVAGPHYPMRPWMQCRITADYNGSTYPVFRGYVTEWRVNWDKDWGSSWSTVDVELTDAVGLLVNWNLHLANYSTAQATGTRLGEILDDALQPSGLRTASWYAGYTCGTISYTDKNESAVSAWQVLSDAVATGSADVALVWTSEGKASYKAAVETGYVFGDAQNGSEIPYTAAGIPYGTDHYANDVKVTIRDAAVADQVYDGTLGTGVDTYLGLRSITRETILRDSASGANDADDLADDLLTLLAEPTTRPESVTVRITDPDLAWTPILDIGQEDIILLRRRPPGGGGMYQQACRVVSITHSLQEHINNWTTTYRLAGGTI